MRIYREGKEVKKTIWRGRKMKKLLMIRSALRRFRIRFKLFNFSEKLRINGVVECKCGGQIISNTGKVLMSLTYVHEIKCGKCGKSYNADEVFFERKENKRIVFE